MDLQSQRSEEGIPDGPLDQRGITLVCLCGVHHAAVLLRVVELQRQSKRESICLLMEVRTGFMVILFPPLSFLDSFGENTIFNLVIKREHIELAVAEAGHDQLAHKRNRLIRSARERRTVSRKI